MPGPWPCSESLPEVAASRVALKAKRSFFFLPAPSSPSAWGAQRGVEGKGTAAVLHHHLPLHSSCLEKHLWIVFFPSLYTVFKTSVSFFLNKKQMHPKKKPKPNLKTLPSSLPCLAPREALLLSRRLPLGFPQPKLSSSSSPEPAGG